MPLDLTDITICAADSVNVPLTVRALERCVNACKFGAAMLFTDAAVSGAFTSVAIAPLRSKQDYNTFALKILPQHITTPFALIVQWDGYVLDPQAWSSEFKKYDYIGARWPWHQDGMTVGNGGFSLRSRKLLRALESPDIEFTPGAPEDNLICRVNRKTLESKHGIRFAPEAVADQFAFERSAPQMRTFGFHGLFNMWRHMDDDALISLASDLNATHAKTREYIELMLACFELNRPLPFNALYAKTRVSVGADEIHGLILSITSNAQLTGACVSAGERLLRA